MVGRVVVVLVLVLGGAACGNDKTQSKAASSTSSSASATGLSNDECVDRMVATANSIDISMVNAEDGLDDVERESIKAQTDELAKVHPELDSDGECADAFDSLSEDEQAAVFARIDPEIALVLGLAAQQKFSVVGSSIN